MVESRAGKYVRPPLFEEYGRLTQVHYRESIMRWVCRQYNQLTTSQRADRMWLGHEGTSTDDGRFVFHVLTAVSRIVLAKQHGRLPLWRLVLRAQ